MSKLSKMFGAIFLSLFFVACAAAADPGTAEPVATTDQPATDPNGELSDTVTIGVLAPLTGALAQFGVPVYNGINLYIDAFNEQGGLQIQLISFDEEGSPTEAVLGYNWLIDQGMATLIGSVTSGSTLAVVPFANEDNMPMISATSTHANVTVNADTGEVWHNVFRASFIDPFQGEKMAEFASEILEAQTAAILFNNETDYSIGLRDTFEARAQELGIEILTIEAFSNDTVDFVGQLTNIAAVNPDVLFIPAYAQDIALIGPQSVIAGLDTVMIGADGWDSAVFSLADPSSIEGSFFLSGFSAEDPTPIVYSFITRYEDRFGYVPNMFAAQAYDAAMIMVAAVQQAILDGYTPNTDDFNNAVIANMAATDIYAVTGHITFDQYNNPQKTAFIIEIIDGDEILWGTF